MSDTAFNSSFYRPQVRELGFAACYVLERAGGQLSFDRTAEVAGDFLEIPEEERNQIREETPQYTEFTYCLAWACSGLRSKGFMARNQSGTWGECILTEAGHELGRWACRLYDGDNPELPDWVQAFLRPTFSRMVSLLKGGKRSKPPDYELCRWVRYCYLLSRAALGIAVFNLILADHVAPGLYKQAERQARILKLRVKESEQRQLDRLLAVGQTTNGVANNGAVQMRQLVLDNAPPGTRVRTLMRNVYNEIRELTDDGLVVLSSKSRRERLIPWQVIQRAYEVLFADGEIDPTRVTSNGSFVCALLAHMTEAQADPHEAVVRLTHVQAQRNGGATA